MKLAGDQFMGEVSLKLWKLPQINEMGEEKCSGAHVISKAALHEYILKMIHLFWESFLAFFALWRESGTLCSLGYRLRCCFWAPNSDRTETKQFLVHVTKMSLGIVGPSEPCANSHCCNSLMLGTFPFLFVPLQFCGRDLPSSGEL